MNFDTLTNKKRLFVIGCSFTNYLWPTWADILAHDLDITYINLGRSGAGNQYISNRIVQAHLEYKFTKDDIVIIQWSNMLREDIFLSDDWVTPGNFFTSTWFEDKFKLYKEVPVKWFILRDFFTIYTIQEFFKNKKCCFIQFKMQNFLDLDAHQQNSHLETEMDFLKSLYDKYFNLDETILPSFFEILWDNNISNKGEQCTELGIIQNWHPTVSEHFKYISKVLNHKFKSTTKVSVEKAQIEWESIVLNNKPPKIQPKKDYIQLLDKLQPLFERIKL